MADAVTLVVLILATYRISTDVAYESGPGGAFELLRGWVVTRFTAEWVREGIQCPICISFWVAPCVIGLHAVAPLVVVWLAVAGAVAAVVRR